MISIDIAHFLTIDPTHISCMRIVLISSKRGPTDKSEKAKALFYLAMNKCRNSAFAFNFIFIFFTLFNCFYSFFPLLCKHPHQMLHPPSLAQ